MVKALRQRLDFIGPFDWAIMGILIGLFIGAVFGSRAAHAASAGVDWFSWWDGFLQNSGTELLGAFLTFVLLELVRGSREKEESKKAEEERKREITAHVDQALVAYQKQLDEQEKQALINQLSSAVPGLPAEAVRLLRHKEWLEDKDVVAGLHAGGDFHLANLREAVLDGLERKALKLSQANLWRADLQGDKLDHANFQNANLKRASLEVANLWKANLAGADLAEANLGGTNLKRANLRGARLMKTDLAGAELNHANLEDADFGAADLEGANLWKANLERTNLAAANLKRAHLREANLEGAHLREANLEEADLIEANLEGANLREANLEWAHLREANLEGVDLIGAKLERADLIGANLEGANLSRANLKGASFEGATLPDGTRLPGRDTNKPEWYNDPEPNWWTPFEAWDKDGRPRIKPTADEPENNEEI